MGTRKVCVSDRLLQAAARGDEEAFAALVRETAPLIRTLVGGFRHSGPEDEDLAQEALVGLLSAVRTYRADGGAVFTTYATTCIRHRLISAVRQFQARAGRERPLEEEEEIPASPVSDPAVFLQQQEDARRLIADWQQRLTPLEYKVLLARLGNSSYEEIAAQLNVSKKTVDNAVQRLRRKLAAGR